MKGSDKYHYKITINHILEKTLVDMIKMAPTEFSNFDIHCMRFQMFSDGVLITLTNGDLFLFVIGKYDSLGLPVKFPYDSDKGCPRHFSFKLPLADFRNDIPSLVNVVYDEVDKSLVYSINGGENMPLEETENIFQLVPDIPKHVCLRKDKEITGYYHFSQFALAEKILNRILPSGNCCGIKLMERDWLLLYSSLNYTLLLKSHFIPGEASSSMMLPKYLSSVRIRV